MINFTLHDDKLYIDGHQVLAAWETYLGWYWFGTERAYTQDFLLQNGRTLDDPAEIVSCLRRLESLPGKIQRIRWYDLPRLERRNTQCVKSTEERR